MVEEKDSIQKATDDITRLIPFSPYHCITCKKSCSATKTLIFKGTPKVLLLKLIYNNSNTNLTDKGVNFVLKKYELSAILTFRKDYYKTLIVYNDRVIEFNDILFSDDHGFYEYVP